MKVQKRKAVIYGRMLRLEVVELSFNQEEFESLFPPGTRSRQEYIQRILRNYIAFKEKSNETRRIQRMG